jgi:tRNA-binding protein
MSVKKESPQKPQITFGKFENVDMRVARVVSAPMAEGTRFPCRVMTLDLGHLGSRTCIGQYALVPEDELVGKKVVTCVNLGTREMGPYLSEVLLMGVPHPDGPSDQGQATPLVVSDRATPGDQIF